MTDRCLSCGKPFREYGAQAQAHIATAAPLFGTEQTTGLCWGCLLLALPWAARQAREALNVPYHGAGCTCECCRPDIKEPEEKGTPNPNRKKSPGISP